MTAPLLLGIEIGATKLQLALGRGDGEIVALRRLAAEPAAGARGIWAQIVSALEPLRSTAGVARGAVAAAGVGFGGPVDAERGVVVRSHQVAGWDGAPLADWVRRDLGIPIVSVHNDADTAALGEALHGAGAGRSPVLYVNSGSGVGGGLVVDGRIYRGGSGVGALEVGHLRVFPDASMSLGRADFVAWGDLPEPPVLEQVASGWAIGRAGAALVEQGRGPILASLAGSDPSRVDARLVADAARRGDSECLRLFDDATTAMAQALAHAVTLLAPRRVVLGGGVSLVESSLWLDPIRRKLAARVFGPFAGTFDVVTATLGEAVVVHGALALARAAWEAAGSPAPLRG
jgi:glucokinase